MNTEMTNSTGSSNWLEWQNRLRRLWRKRVQPQRHDSQWFTIGGVWLIALYLGYVGFAKHAAMMGESHSPWDLLYLTLQLISMNSGAVPGPISWELEMARLLLPVLAAYTVVKALTILFREQVKLMRLRFIRDHVVICGLGSKGFLLAKSFRQHGDRVIVIEQNEDNSLLEQCRAWGTVVLIGDATDTAWLHKASVHKAKYLISVCGDDGTNAEVAVRAQGLSADRKGDVLSCIIHIVDPQLCDLLREREIGTEEVSAFRLEFFNVFDRGARLLLQEIAALSSTDETQDRPPHLLVIGLGRMGESLVVHAAREWHDKHPLPDQQLRITVIDRAANWKSESLCVRYPQLAGVCELVTREMDVYSPEFQRAEFLYNSQGLCDVNAVCICLDNDSLGLYAGLALLRQVRHHKIPIVIRMAEGTGLATLLQGEHNGKGTFDNLHAFGLLDRTCTPNLVLGGTHEILARALHEDYVRHQEQLGQTSQTNPTMVPWDSLPERFRESNRRQVDHIGIRLKDIGFEILPLTNWDTASYEFTPDEIERMAQMEHKRWCDELRREGWRYAPGPKNPDKQTHPDLVSWESLSEPEKEKNRNAVRELPGFLAQAGFEVHRLK